MLITGESGTGKDVVARTLYARSRRAARPFVAVDCTGGASLESDLFASEGQLAAARGGTVFFDEVAEMPERVQARVAHAMQGAHGIGSRVLAATHHDLRRRVAEGRFREDLYFLLSTVDLAVPPLRERKGDLPLLVNHFLERLTPPGLVPPGVSPTAWGALEAYDFPGNVRELARVVEHAMVLAHGSEIDREHLLPSRSPVAASTAPERSPRLAVALERQFEREYVRRAVAICDGDLDRAAGMLGLPPESLTRKLGGRLSEPPPAFTTEGAGVPRSFGPVKAGTCARDGAGGEAVSKLVDGEAAQAGHAASHAKIRTRAGDR